MKQIFSFLMLFLVFVSNAQLTNEIQKIPAAITDPDNIYGLVYYPRAVAASEQYMLCTYPGIVSDSLDSATIFKKTNQTWELDTVLFSTGSPAGFGYAACMNDEFLFVSAYQDAALGDQVGSVFIYQRVGNTWQLIQNIYPNFVDGQAHFGNKLTLIGDYLFVRNNKGPDGYASVEVFHLENGQWNFSQSFTGMRASGISSNGELVIILGSEFNDVFEFVPLIFTCTLQGESWAVSDTVAIEDTNNNDFPDVSISNENKMVVSELYENSHSFRFLTWENNTWQLTDTLTVMSTGITSFEYYNDYLFVGYGNVNHIGPYSGLAEAYKREAGNWISLGEIAPSDHGDWDEFGLTMAISNDQLLLGSYDLQGSVYMGAVYAFQITGCDDPNACNYTSGITSAIDALCTYPGCTNVGACNYDPLTCEGGECIFGEEGDLDCSGTFDINDLNLLLAQFGCTSDCDPFDLDGDGVVGMSDLMMMIGLVE